MFTNLLRNKKALNTDKYSIFKAFVTWYRLGESNP